MLWEVPALKLTVIHHQHHFFEKINFLWFSIFELWVCGLWRQNFDLSGRISADWLYFRKIYCYNSFSFKMTQLIRISSFCSPNFPIFCWFSQNQYFYLHHEEFFGMSSYGPESSSIEKFTFSASFFIFMVYLYLQPIKSYSPILTKN